MERMQTTSQQHRERERERWEGETIKRNNNTTINVQPCMMTMIRIDVFICIIARGAYRRMESASSINGSNIQYTIEAHAHHVRSQYYGQPVVNKVGVFPTSRNCHVTKPNWTPGDSEHTICRVGISPSPLSIIHRTQPDAHAANCYKLSDVTK